MTPSLAEIREPDRQSVEPSQEIVPVVVDFVGDEFLEPRFPGLIRYRDEAGQEILPSGVAAGLAFAAFQTDRPQRYQFELVLASDDLEFRTDDDEAEIFWANPANPDGEKPAPASAFVGSLVDRGGRRCTLSWSFSEEQEAFVAYPILEVIDTRSSSKVRLGYLPMVMAFVTEETVSQVFGEDAEGSAEASSRPRLAAVQPPPLPAPPESGGMVRDDALLKIDVEASTGGLPRYSIFNNALIPDDLLVQPAFIVYDREELHLELNLEHAAFEPLPDRDFEAEIQFFDSELKKMTTPPRAYLANRLSEKNRRCRSFWRFEHTTAPSTSREASEAWQVASFFLLSTGPARGLDRLRQGWVDPTVLQPPPVGGGGLD